MAKAGRGDDQYMVRFPKGLRDRVKASAEANGRSMNSEIIARLEESFVDDEPAPASGWLGRRYDIPEDTPNEVLDEVIQRSIAKALRGLEIRRVPAKKEGDD